VEFFSKYVEHRTAKYAAVICENRPQLHTSDIIHLGLTTAMEIGITHALTVLCTLLFYVIACMLLFSSQRIFIIMYAIIELENYISIFFVLLFFVRKRPKYAGKICDICILLKYAENSEISEIYGNRIFTYF